MGGWSRKWQFSLTLVSEIVLMYLGGWVVQKSLKTPLRNIKMGPNSEILCIRVPIFKKVHLQLSRNNFSLHKQVD